MSNPRIVCRFIPAPEGHDYYDGNEPEYRLVHTGARYELQRESYEDWELVEAEHAFGVVASLLAETGTRGKTFQLNEANDAD